MKKFLKYGICGLAAVMLLAGCAKKDNETETGKGVGSVFSNEFGSVTLGQYSGMEVLVSADVTEEELDEQLALIVASNPEYVEITDRPAQNGDIVNIDYVGMKDGVAFQGGTAAGYNLELGSNSFIDGFEAGLVGANKGEERSLNLTFPDPYSNAELAGQPVVFDVTVNSIEGTRPSQLDEAFVQRMTDFTTVDEFREDVRASLKDYKQSQIDENLETMQKSSALQMAIDNAAYEFNEEAVQAEYDAYYEAAESNATMYGITLEQLLSMNGMNLDDYKLQLREETEVVIKQQLLAEAIAAAEALELSDEFRQEVADGEGMTIDEAIEAYGKEEMDRVAQIYQVVEFIYNHSVFK